MVQIKSVKERVKDFLVKDEKCRDSDDRLISLMWYFEACRYFRVNGLSEVTAEEFLQAMAMGKLTNSESIRRCRQKIQEESKHLRGASYSARHDHQDEIKDQLGY